MVLLLVLGFPTAAALKVLGDTFEGEQVEKLLAEADILKDWAFYLETAM